MIFPMVNIDVVPQISMQNASFSNLLPINIIKNSIAAFILYTGDSLKKNIPNTFLQDIHSLGNRYQGKWRSIIKYLLSVLVSQLQWFT